MVHKNDECNMLIPIGARVANASVALNEPFHQILAPVDTVSICMSKGLGAPVGSIIAGSEEFIYNVCFIYISIRICF